MKILRRISIFLLLICGMSVGSIQADSLGFDPITIYTETCNVDEEQSVFFDILIMVESNRLLSVMNETYLNEYPNGEGYEYHNIEGYDSYLAYYPDAEFASINCYMSAYTFLESGIAEYKLVAFDANGDIITVSDTFNIEDVGYDTSINVVKYYEYDYTNHTFQIIQDDVEVSGFGQTIDFVGSFIVSLLIYFVLAFVGIIPFMVNSKKLHKEEYIQTLLTGNALIFMGLLFLLNLPSNGLLVFGIIILSYIIAMAFVFIKLNKRYNPTYKLNDLFYILLGYALLVGLTILVLS